MKTSDAIKELAVFSIIDGKEIGKVKELLINPGEKTVAYFIVDIPNWHLGLKVIPLSLVEGIGEDAVMIESENIVKNLNEEPVGIELVERDIKLIGNKVLTNKGRVIGKVSEFYVDEDNGQVSGLELVDSNNNIKGIIPTDVTLTFGKDALVVNNDVENHLISCFEKTQEEPLSELETINEGAAEVEIEVQLDDEEAQRFEETSVLEQEETESIPMAEDKTEVANLFEQRQREYLIGKKATQDIVDSQGEIIIRKDDTITEEVIEKVTVAGKFKELVLNV